MKFHHQNVSTSMAFGDFLQVIYPTEAKYRLAAASLLKAISTSDEKGLDGYEMSKICEENSISRATMQKVFVHLRALGMVDRRAMKYYLNTEFSSATRKLSEAWRNLIKDKKFEFEKETVKLSVG